MKVDRTNINDHNNNKSQFVPWYHTPLAYVLGASIVSGGSIFALQEYTKKALYDQFAQEKKHLQQQNQLLQERNTQLYKQNASFHVKGFNKRLTEKGVTIYSGLGDIVPYTNEKLNKNILEIFATKMNTKEEIMPWLYSSEYHHYSARQALSGQSLQYAESKKMDLYTLDIDYDGMTKEVREDIMAIIAEGNFKALVQEYYQSVSFHEIFALARTIVSNIRQPINTYSFEERELIMRLVIQQRIMSAKKQVLSQDHTLVNIVGKDGIFSTTQSFIDLYKSLVPQSRRHLYQFRDHGFADYRGDSGNVYTTVGQHLQKTGIENRPYMLLLANHGGLQEDRKSGRMNLVDGKLYLEANGIKKWLSYTRNMPNAVSSIQFLHCYANHTAHPILVDLEQEMMYDEHLPIIIVQSDFFETSFGSSQDSTPYRQYLTITTNTPLLLGDYYAAHRQPLGFNASVYVPYCHGISSEDWEASANIWKHKKYIQQY